MLMTSTSPELPIAAQRVGRIGPAAASRNYKPDGRSREDIQSTFDLQVSRCQKLLHFIARRILNCAEEAEVSVHNCRLTSSHNPPRFSTEVAFKNFMARILSEEAQHLLNRQTSPTPPAS